jgi:hypothetical protein
MEYLTPDQIDEIAQVNEDWEEDYPSSADASTPGLFFDDEDIERQREIIDEYLEEKGGEK